ncbi:MAG: hypothetical protein C4522_15650 [Desulfobacteraceae bacterium]|nr:MAG: hypothetical protein C4522_15650 [Desulfobacteraceae bacterium]
MTSCKNHPIEKILVLSLISTIMLCLFVNPCKAHKLTVYAWVQSDTVYGEAAYNDGSYAKSCRVTIIDSRDKLIARVITDKEGKFFYRLPHTPAAPVKIIINDGMGHHDEYIISQDELINQLDSPAPTN